MTQKLKTPILHLPKSAKADSYPFNSTNENPYRVAEGGCVDELPYDTRKFINKSLSFLENKDLDTTGRSRRKYFKINRNHNKST